MAKGTKHHSSASRRQQILFAADFVLNTVGVEDFTIDKVVEQSGLSKGTIYKQYASKDELLAELSMKALSLLLARFQESTAPFSYSIDKIRAACIACYHYAESHPNYFNLISYMERPDLTISIEDYVKISHNVQSFFMKIITDGQEQGEIKKELKPILVHNILWASCVGVTQFLETKRNLIHTDEDVSGYDMIICYSEMITTGLKS